MTRLVNLSAAQCAQAASYGASMTGRAVRGQFGDGHGEPRANRTVSQRVTHDRIAALGEMALAVALGLPYAPDSEEFGTGDVGVYQVRATAIDYGHLIVFDRDRDHQIHVLVIVREQASGAACRIVGAMVGRDAKQDRYRQIAERLVRPGSPVQYWVPQRDLRGFP